MNKSQLMRIEKGLCVMCGASLPLPGTKKCVACTLMHRKLNRERRQRLTAQHRCQKCGQPMPDDWYYVICTVCKERNDRLYLARTERRRAQGLCPKCGLPMDREGGKCTACYEKSKEYLKRWRSTNG